MMQDTSTSRGGAGRAQAHVSSAARAAALLLRRCQPGPNPLSDADSLEFRQSGEHVELQTPADVVQSIPTPRLPPSVCNSSSRVRRLWFRPGRRRLPPVTRPELNIV